MSFWSTATIRERGPDIVEPFHEEQIENCAYELTLGPEAYETGTAVGRKQMLQAGDTVVIAPGHFALLLSEEKLQMPADCLGLISVKARFKLRGLISVSGFHVDPGFNGRFLFSVYNAGASNVVIARGERAFLLWFGSLDYPTEDTYKGQRLGQSTISSHDIMALGDEQFSPVAVGRRVATLEERVDRLVHTGRALIVGALLVVAAWWLSRIDTGASSTPSLPVPSSVSAHP